MIPNYYFFLLTIVIDYDLSLNPRKTISTRTEKEESRVHSNLPSPQAIWDWRKLPEYPSPALVQTRKHLSPSYEKKRTYYVFRILTNFLMAKKDTLVQMKIYDKTIKNWLWKFLLATCYITSRKPRQGFNLMCQGYPLISTWLSESSTLTTFWNRLDKICRFIERKLKKNW